MNGYPTPTSGKPFYCIICGGGFGEYMACELPDCELESNAAAKRRVIQSALAEPEDGG